MSFLRMSGGASGSACVRLAWARVALAIARCFSLRALGCGGWWGWWGRTCERLPLAAMVQAPRSAPTTRIDGALAWRDLLENLIATVGWGGLLAVFELMAFDVALPIRRGLGLRAYGKTSHDSLAPVQRHMSFVDIDRRPFSPPHVTSLDSIW